MDCSLEPWLPPVLWQSLAATPGAAPHGASSISEGCKERYHIAVAQYHQTLICGQKHVSPESLQAGWAALSCITGGAQLAITVMPLVDQI